MKKQKNCPKCGCEWNKDNDTVGCNKCGHIQHEKKPLSKREKEVCMMLAKGLRYMEIGYQLGISPRTVETYFNNSKRKLGAKTQSETIALFVKGKGGVR